MSVRYPRNCVAGEFIFGLWRFRVPSRYRNCRTLCNFTSMFAALPVFFTPSVASSGGGIGIGGPKGIATPRQKWVWLYLSKKRITARAETLRRAFRSSYCIILQWGGSNSRIPLRCAKSGISHPPSDEIRRYCLIKNGEYNHQCVRATRRYALLGGLFPTFGGFIMEGTGSWRGEGIHIHRRP